ncbi:MAG: response regulator [Thermodesulfobacteriota bacterium]|nr:response regulator [Thermodesulfobacteriota bacterium]
MKRIVIADDSGTARMMIRRCLEIIGLAETEFVEAENGKEGLTMVKQAPTDLLISDLNMPIMDGETLLKWVKASPKLGDLPVLIITSAGNPAKSKQLLEMGAYSVINKPINPAMLSEVLAPLLNSEEG